MSENKEKKTEEKIIKEKPEKPKIDIKDKSYLLQEANLLGTRIQWYLEQHEKIETLGLFSSGALWAFIMTQSWNPDNEAILYLRWLPVLLTIVLFIKSTLFTKTIREAFQYIWEIEEDYELPEGKGWVHYFRKNSSKYKSKWRKFFWILLNVINILVPLLFPFEQLLKTVTE